MAIFRADASAQIGTGHIMRCLALAQAWQAKAKGGTVCFVCAEITPGLEARLIHEGIAVVRIDAKPGSIDDISRTIAMAEEKKAVWIVLDGYIFGANYQKAVKQAGFRLLCIDDFGHANHYHADLVLNQNISVEASIYKSFEPYTHLLLGTRYALLRKEFCPWRGWKRTIPDKARNIMVTMGGSDPDNVTLKVIQTLASLNDPELDFRIIVGPGSPHIEALRKALDQNANGQPHHNNQPLSSGRCTMQLLQNITDMPPLMAWADVAISAGGTTSWELAFMGLPSIVLSLAFNQEGVVSRLERIGLAIRVTFNGHLNISLTDILTSLVSNKDLRRNMSHEGRMLVD